MARNPIRFVRVESTADMVIEEGKLQNNDLAFCLEDGSIKLAKDGTLIPMGGVGGEAGPVITVEDILTSDSTENALSAAQGKKLNDEKLDKTDVVTDIDVEDDSELTGKAVAATTVKTLKASIPTVVDDLTTDEGTKALSAAQGKKLSDDKLNKTDVVEDLDVEDESELEGKAVAATAVKTIIDSIPTVIDNLTTDEGTKALSAAQGKKLSDDKLDKTDVVDDLDTEDDLTGKAAAASTVKALDAKVTTISSWVILGAEE